MGCLLSGTEEQEILLVLSGTISVGFALGILQLVTRTGGCIQHPKSSFEAELGKDFSGNQLDIFSLAQFVFFIFFMKVLAI